MTRSARAARTPRSVTAVASAGPPARRTERARRVVRSGVEERGSRCSVQAPTADRQTCKNLNPAARPGRATVPRTQPSAGGRAPRGPRGPRRHHHGQGRVQGLGGDAPASGPVPGAVRLHRAPQPSPGSEPAHPAEATLPPLPRALVAASVPESASRRRAANHPAVELMAAALLSSVGHLPG